MPATRWASGYIRLVLDETVRLPACLSLHGLTPMSPTRRQFLKSVAAGAYLSTLGLENASLASPTGRHKQPFRGVFIIMQTPFLESLQIDEPSLARETDFLVR